MVQDHGIIIAYPSTEKISIGNGAAATAYGETKAIQMQIGTLYLHTSTYTVMHLGEYDAVLGIPWFKHAKCTCSFGTSLPQLQVHYKRGIMTLPLRMALAMTTAEKTERENLFFDAGWE